MPVQNVEGRTSVLAVCCRVVGVENKREDDIPVPLPLRDVACQQPLDGPVEPFNLAICLWMVGCSEGFLGVDDVA